MILRNILGCIAQPHLAKVSSVPGSYCNRPNRSVASSLQLWSWFWRRTLNGTTWLRWYAYKAPTSSLSTILWLIVLRLIILAKNRKQGNETLSNAYSVSVPYKGQNYVISTQFCRWQCEVLTSCIRSLIFSSPACFVFLVFFLVRGKVNFVTLCLILIFMFFLCVFFFPPPSRKFHCLFSAG